MPTNAPNAQAITYDGNSAFGPFADTWDNVQVIPNMLGQVCYYFGASDTVMFRRATCNPSGVGAISAILFDYTKNATWPANITFWDLDIYTNTISNIGSPDTSGGINLNKIYDLSRINGASVPHLANLAIMDYFVTGGNAPTITGGCNGAGSSVATGSTNSSGTITGQTAAATGCTITFAAFDVDQCAGLCRHRTNGTADKHVCNIYYFGHHVCKYG